MTFVAKDHDSTTFFFDQVYGGTPVSVEAAFDVDSKMIKRLCKSKIFDEIRDRMVTMENGPMVRCPKVEERWTVPKARNAGFIVDCGIHQWPYAKSWIHRVGVRADMDVSSLYWVNGTVDEGSVAQKTGGDYVVCDHHGDPFAVDGEEPVGFLRPVFKLAGK